MTAMSPLLPSMHAMAEPMLSESKVDIFGKGQRTMGIDSSFAEPRVPDWRDGNGSWCSRGLDDGRFGIFLHLEARRQLIQRKKFGVEAFGFFDHGGVFNQVH